MLHHARRRVLGVVTRHARVRVCFGGVGDCIGGGAYGARRHFFSVFSAPAERVGMLTCLSPDRNGARTINTKSPLEDDLEKQRAVDAQEKARKEMFEDANAIEKGRVGKDGAGSSSGAGSATSKSQSSKRPAFGAPIGTGVGGSRTNTTPVHEKPKAKTTVVKAPTLGVAMFSDGTSKSGPAGNRNLMPEPPADKGSSQAHLQDMLSDGSFEKYGVGGLDTEFLTIFRRVFASRMVDSEVVKKLGMRHVKGILLHGPPGTGKTLVAKQLGRLLNAHPPKIVNGPEILQRFVGQSEENMRDLFAPAEKEFKGKGDKSKLHVLIFDEIDAIMKTRGSGGATASVVHDNVVNQLLTKLDGMQSLNNVLVVGITNRRDLLDPAVLRPGRLELQVEVGLPDLFGRQQIFNIHTSKMRVNGLLSDCVDIQELSQLTTNYSGAEIKGLVGAAQSHALARYLVVDGGDGSSADSSNADSSVNDASAVTMADFQNALNEVRPVLGADSEALDALRPLGTLCSCGTGTRERSPHKRARDALPPLLRAVLRGGGGGDGDDSSEQDATPPTATTQYADASDHLSVLVHGPPGCGSSALTAEAASIVPFPSVRVFRADVAAASGADACLNALRQAFDDATKAKVSLLVVDGLETLLGVPPGDVGFTKGYSLSGGSFGRVPTTYDGSSAPTTLHAEHTATMVRNLRALLRKPPPSGRRLAIVATTSSPETMRALGVADAFHTHIAVPALSRVEAEHVLAASGAFGEDDGEKAAEFLSASTPIKVLLRAVSLAKKLENDVSYSADTKVSGGFFGGGSRQRGVGLDPIGEAWTTALRRVNLTPDDRGSGGVF